MSNDNEFRKQAVEIIGNCVCKERNEAYGSVEENFSNIADLWTWWLKKRGMLSVTAPELTVLDVAQMIAFIKIARKLNDIEYLDNWIDDAGYNACGAAEILREKNQVEAKLKVKAKSRAKSRAKNKANAEANDKMEALRNELEAEANEPAVVDDVATGTAANLGDGYAEREPEHAGQGGEPAEVSGRNGRGEPSVSGHA
jgi:hypothetical protein